MAPLDLDDTEQPMDPMLVMAIEAAFRSVTTTTVEFVPAPRSWTEANPGGGVSGPKGPRKQAIRFRLAQRDGARCAYCAREFVDLDDATLDHVIPNSIVRHWQEWNLLLSCSACNNLKDNRVPAVLMPLLCLVLRDLMPLARTKRIVQEKRARRREQDKAQRQAATQARQRQALVRKQLEALAGAPIRLAIEGGK